MIDAYEIGIQLLLQDGVSDGLVVIHRELAEMDQAIAATSAELANLAQQADRTTKAVAAAAAGQTAAVAVRDNVAAAGLNGEMGPQSKRERTAERITQPEPAAAPERTRASQPSFPAERAQVPSEPTERLLQHQTRAALVTPGIATAPSPAQNLVVSENRAVTPSSPFVSIAISRAETASPKSSSANPTPASPMPSHAAPRSGRPAGAVLTSNTGVTASLGDARGQRAPTARPEQARHSPGPFRTADREKPVSPWPESDVARTYTEAPRVSLRATAPQPQSRERSEGGGGTVMLDGRLVGQWLTEHMAREASRPPGGTSFFDPRQTPAWTVSGAL